jgi:hypothetical protein
MPRSVDDLMTAARHAYGGAKAAHLAGNQSNATVLWLKAGMLIAAAEGNAERLPVELPHPRQLYQA